MLEENIGWDGNCNCRGGVKVFDGGVIEMDGEDAFGWI